MEQLTAFDALWLKTEDKDTPQHITQIYIYDPSTAESPIVRFKDILERYRSRQHLSPIFQKQLVRVPFELDNPYWIETDDVDVEYHVRHLALPKPGDWRQLCILFSRLHSLPIDVRRPMWQVYVIEGLDNVEGFPKGAFAIVTKIHHSVADGKAVVGMLEALHDGSPEGSHVPDAWPRYGPKVTASNLLMSAGKNMMLQPFKTASKSKDILLALIQRRKFFKQNKGMLLEQNEKTLFNHGIKSPSRVWGAGIFNISEFLAIKKLVPGATVNDVVLCVTSYVVEDYLAKHAASIREPLISAVAMDTREFSKHKEGQNHATVMAVSTHSHVADPIHRLRAIQAETVLRKQQMREQGVDLMSDVLEAVPPRWLTLGMSFMNRFNLIGQRQLGFHFGSTNVPGPRTPRYLVGAKVVCGFGMAPIIGATGLGFVIGSYCDKLTISFTCDREIVKDPDFLEECIYTAFEKVKSAAVLHAEAAEAKKPKPKGNNKRKLPSSSSKRPAKKKG